MTDKPLYTDAFAELETIVAEIENGEISVDELAAKVKRATVLIQICKEKLSTTENNVSAILSEIDASENTNE